MTFIKIVRWLKELSDLPFFSNKSKTEVFSFTKRNKLVANSRVHSQINCTIPDSKKHVTLYNLNFEMGHRSPTTDFNIVTLNHPSSHPSRGNPSARDC